MGCFGGCNFCALTFHQGRIIQSRSKESIIEEDNIEIKNIVTSDNNMQEALSALQVLGYPQKEAAKAISSVNTENLSVEEIIKKALIYFAKS